MDCTIYMSLRTRNGSAGVPPDLYLRLVGCLSPDMRRVASSAWMEQQGFCSCLLTGHGQRSGPVRRGWNRFRRVSEGMLHAGEDDLGPCANNAADARPQHNCHTVCTSTETHGDGTKSSTFGPARPCEGFRFSRSEMPDRCLLLATVDVTASAAPPQALH
jgi:hypothetical protein